MNLIEEIKKLELDDKITIYIEGGKSFTGIVGETSNENVLVIHQPKVGVVLLDLENTIVKGLKIFQQE